MVLTLPCPARDSVTLCWYARDLGREGAAFLRRPETQQHPLYPLLLLGTQRAARALGAPDTPLTWLRCGQALSLVLGLTVVGLTWALSARLARRLNLPIDARWAGCCGGLLAALLPLNVWLSAEAMSDQLHLALYLLGALLLLRLDSLAAAAACGLVGGLAFLTRPEGLVVAVAGLVALAVRREARGRGRLGRAVGLAAAFMLCAAPYWAVTGTLTAKSAKNPLNWLRRGAPAAAGTGERGTFGTPTAVAAAGHSPRQAARTADCGRQPPLLFAKLELRQYAWYALVPQALLELFRAGRVVVPLLALPALLHLRRRLLRPPLIGVTACAGVHFGLTVLLLWKSQYLHPRHLLVVVALLTPFAALTLAYLVALLGGGGRRVGPVLVVMAAALPLAGYALRQPHYADRYLPEVARWMMARDPRIASKAILSGSSLKRVVFQADARWVPWFEAPWDFPTLREQLARERPDYALFEVGPGFERAGNVAVVDALRTDALVSPRLRAVETLPLPEDATLYVFEFDWAGDDEAVVPVP